MYPFEANMAELQEKYGVPDQVDLESAANIIKHAINERLDELENAVDLMAEMMAGTVVHKNENPMPRSNVESEAKLFMSAAMIFGKIKKPKLVTLFVHNYMKIYANEAHAKKTDLLIKFANDRYGLGIRLSMDRDRISNNGNHTISLQGYLCSAPYDNDTWDLENQQLSKGIITIPLIKINRIVSNIIGDELIKKFQKTTYDGHINPETLELVSESIKYRYISKEIPPCMVYCQQTMNDGEHLSYFGRFTLAAYHGMRGMPMDDIVNMFKNVPDFKENVTRTQIGNLMEKKLMPYSCEKMEQYGLCKRHDRCGKIKNPLSYK